MCEWPALLRDAIQKSLSAHPAKLGFLQFFAGASACTSAGCGQLSRTGTARHRSLLQSRQGTQCNAIPTINGRSILLLYIWLLA